MREQIEKYFLGKLTTEQKNDIFKQMVGNPDARDEFAQIQNSWALAASSGAANDEFHARRYLNEFKKRQNRKKIMAFVIEISKYAAVFVVGALIATGILQKPKIHDVARQTLTVPAGQRAHLVLADGSSVWVNAKSTLEYPGVFTGGMREITLTGEAYFEVAANPAQPFIVKSEHFRTQVTGTKFNVFAYKGFYDVALVEGQVKVYETEITQEPIILNPNERVMLTDGKLVKMNLENTDGFLWKDGIYCFDDMNFLDIVEKLQLYYDVQIIVTNNSLSSIRITGKFRQRDGIDNVLKVLQTNCPFVFSKNEDGSIIYIR